MGYAPHMETLHVLGMTVLVTLSGEQV